MDFSVIITSAYEPSTIKKAIDQVVLHNKELWNKMEVIVVAPDDETLKMAEGGLLKLKERGFVNYEVVRDLGKGKSAAINLAVSKARGSILIFTDGDVYVEDGAIKRVEALLRLRPNTAGVSGHVVSLDSRNTLFGYFSHIFCSAADARRKSNPTTPMSGYLYAIKKIQGLFPIPENLRSEDAYISARILQQNLKIAYASEAKVFVHFPKNMKDWINQKTRSLGGNLQLRKTGLFPADSTQYYRKRSIFNDLSMAFYPMKFAKNPKELLFSLALYPLRLYLWVRIYLIHSTNSYKSGPWERILSTK